MNSAKLALSTTRMTIRELDPKCLWEQFYKLTLVPRPSKHEGQVSLFMEEFGRNLGLKTERDSAGNVIIHKGATPGMENRKKVILQAHMDMVPQKRKDKVHNFETDPIITKIVNIDGEEWVMADGTTLGADDGLGCAIIMAILASKDLKHGAVDGFFTTGEETGMTGIRKVGPDLLDGDILINFDSETEGELYVGCAGGYDFNATFSYEEEPIPEGYSSFEIILDGLLGGHSGLDIEKCRGNANKITARFLLPLLRDYDCRLVSIDGGNMRNAIPRESMSVVAIPDSNIDKALSAVESLIDDVRKELGPIDPNVKVSIRPAVADMAIAKDVALNFVKAVASCPDGVYRMSLEIEGVVDSSNNLSIMHSEGGTIKVTCMLRGVTDSLKISEAEAVRSIFELAGAECILSGWYSGWRPKMDADILKCMIDIYSKMYGHKPAVKALHGGLECGILSSVYPHMEMISCGPTLCSPHSPDERALVSSVAKLWKFIVETLQKIPVK